EFRTKSEMFALSGTIVRTGLIKNNPSDIAQKYKFHGLRHENYIAVQFKTLLENLDETDLLEA
ncbi:MAG TPA: hypothetical protein VF857_03705, partial [Spirochaetota bacterium]